MVSQLWKAAGEGDLSKVRELLKDTSNVHIELKDNTGITPLINAVRNGHLDVVNELLAYGADPNNASSQGRPETYTQDHAIVDALRRRAQTRSPLDQSHHQNGTSPAPPQDANQANHYPPSDPAAAAAAYEHAMRAGYWYMPHPNAMYAAPYGYMAPPPEGMPHMIPAYYPPQPPPQQPQHSPRISRNQSHNRHERQHENGNGSSGSNSPNGGGPSLPPAEVAKTIPCRYFPMCKYGSECIFAHPQGVPAGPSYFNGGGHPGTTPQVVPPSPYAQPPPAFDAHGQPIPATYPANGYYPIPVNGAPPQHAYPPPPPAAHSPTQHTAPSPHPAPYSVEAGPASGSAGPGPVPVPYGAPVYPPPIQIPTQNGVVPHAQVSPVAVYHPYQLQQPSSPVHHRSHSHSNGYPMQQQPGGVMAAPLLNGVDENGHRPYGGEDAYYGANGVREHNGNGGGPRRGGYRRGSVGSRPGKPPCAFFPSGRCKNGDTCRFPHIRPEDDPEAFGPEGFPPTNYPQRHRPRQFGSKIYGPREDVSPSDGSRPMVNGNGNHINGFRKNSPTETNGHGFGGRPSHHHNGMNGYKGGQRNGHLNGIVVPSAAPREVVLTPADFPVLKGSTTPTTPSSATTPSGLTAAQVLKGTLRKDSTPRASAVEDMADAMAKVDLNGEVGKGAETPCPPTPQFPTIAAPFPAAPIAAA